MTPYYQDDAVTIYHGDALELFDSLHASCVITDPPFFMPATHYSSRISWQRSWGDTSILSGWWKQIVNGCLTAGAEWLATFCDGESYPVFYPALYGSFRKVDCLVWDKGRIGMGRPFRRTHELIAIAQGESATWHGGGGFSDIIRATPVPSGERLHPVDKPVALLGSLITGLAGAGDVVLDPFMGGGSTLLAARNAGRHAIGIEVEERYCEIAAKRLAQEVLAP